MKKIIFMFITLFIAAFISTQSFANDINEDYLFYKKIICPQKIDYPYARLWIDQEIYSKANRSLSDLRILDNENHEVPYELIIKRQETQTLAYPATLTDLGYSGKKISFLLDLGKEGAIHNEVILQSRSKNFQAFVQIESSNDKKTWKTIRKNAFIFDISTDYQASHLKISYPESTARYLSISVERKTKELIEITGATIKKTDTSNADEEDRDFIITAKNETGKIAFWELDFGDENIPISRIQLFIAGKNFQRLVKVLIPGKEQGKWVEIKQESIWNFSTKKFTGSNLVIHFNEALTRHLRIEIHNFDNPALTISRFKLYGIKRELFFPTNQIRPYNLYYGNKNATSPKYDLASFTKYLDKPHSHIFSLGTQNFNPHYKPPKDKRPWTERYPIIFWSILVSCCLILGRVVIKKASEIANDKK